MELDVQQTPFVKQLASSGTCRVSVPESLSRLSEEGLVFKGLFLGACHRGKCFPTVPLAVS